MRCEDQLFRQYAKLLQNFSGVPMIEDRVGGKVFRHFNEMSFLRGLFTRAGNSDLESQTTRDSGQPVLRGPAAPAPE